MSANAPQHDLPDFSQIGVDEYLEMIHQRIVAGEMDAPSFRAFFRQTVYACLLQLDQLDDEDEQMRELAELPLTLQ